MKRFALLVALLFASVSQAGFQFTVGNPGITGNPNVTSPYADLTLTDSTTDGGLAANQVKFVLTLLNGNDAKFGELGFNLSDPLTPSDVSLVSLTGTGGNFSTWGLTAGGQMDGFGGFAMEVGPTSNAAGNRLTSLTFVLQTDTPTASVSDFVSLNSGAGNPPGMFAFSAEYFPSAGGTGFIGTSVEINPHSVVPEPASLTLLGIAIACGGLYQWRRRKSCQPT